MKVLHFEMFSGKTKHFISIHSRSSFSLLFSVLKTIFQVQVRKTLEHNRLCPDIVQVLLLRILSKEKTLNLYNGTYVCT